MAKKINFKAGVNVSQMVDILKREKIEHVRVMYPECKKHPARDYIVVRNVNKSAVCEKCGNNVARIKSVRHFEAICKRHAKNYFEPQFECTCRNCGKKFTHHIKEAVWCSDNCYKEFRLKKKQTV